MRIHRSAPSRDFTIIPNATLRDQRLSAAARGVLVELLSRPDGWQTNADAMSESAHRARPRRAEGRRAMRSAFAELESAGYLVHTKVRDEGGRWRTETDVYDTASPDWGTASGTPVTNSEDEYSPSLHRGTAYGTSVGGTSIERQIKKTKEDSRAPDAFASGKGGAIAPPPETTRIPRQRRPPSLEDHLTDLGDDVVEDILISLYDQRGSVVPWAVKKARARLGLPADEEDWGTGRLAVKTCALALMALNKDGGIPDDAEDLLGGWAFPIPSPREMNDAPKVRERTWTDYLRPEQGADEESVLGSLYKHVDRMSTEGLKTAAEAFAANRPRVHRDCVESAEEQLQAEGTEATTERVTRLALKYGLRHYTGKWPAWLVPSSAVRTSR